jgi:hypothetical protein
MVRGTWLGQKIEPYLFSFHKGFKYNSFSFSRLGTGLLTDKIDNAVRVFCNHRDISWKIKALVRGAYQLAAAKFDSFHS